MRSIINARVAITSMIAFASTLVGGCGSEPTTFSPNNTDSFVNYNGDNYTTASKVIAADYLFSIDTSFSMKSYQSTLVNTIASDFMQELENANPPISFRIGFVEGTYQFGSGRPSSFGKSLMGGNYLTSLSTGPIDSILDYLGGNNNPNVTEPLEASKRLMAAMGSSFMRMGAQLVLVYVTDCDPQGDDDSPDSSTDYANYMKARKPSSAYVSARSMVDKSQCTKLQSAVRKMNSDSDPNGTGSDNSGSYNIGNSGNIASNLASLARDISKTTKRFQLRGRPVDGTLSVKVNNANIPKAANWTYIPSSNEVEFVVAPATSAHVEFNYKVDFILSSNPVQESIKVAVNGTEVPQSSSNGWTYEATGNRIVFHGSSYPADEAAVNVTYEVN